MKHRYVVDIEYASHQGEHPVYVTVTRLGDTYLEVGGKKLKPLLASIGYAILKAEEEECMPC